MAKYVTKQRRVLLEYLSMHSDEQYTVRELSAVLGKERISVSAIYRNLLTLESENQVKRFIRDRSHECFFQYVASESCHDHLHLSCRVCGRCLHMNDREAEELVMKTLKQNGFKIDKGETVLYGICASCGK